jgi:hypothetical protein
MPLSPPARPNDLALLKQLELGSDIQDPLILDLVTYNPTSVRLRAIITDAAANGSLPLERLSEYVAAGERAADRFFRLPNMGAKQ